MDNEGAWYLLMAERDALVGKLKDREKTLLATEEERANLEAALRKLLKTRRGLDNAESLAGRRAMDDDPRFASANRAVSMWLSRLDEAFSNAEALLAQPAAGEERERG